MLKDKEAQRKYAKDYYLRTGEKQRADRREWYKNNKESVLEYNKVWYKNNRDKVQAVAKERMTRVRYEVLDHYGGKCACCDEATKEFLALDHIDGGGCQHRKEIGRRGGYTFYLWIVQNNYPDGFQVLCHNCNMAKAFYGVCPHESRECR